jgi:hypothetical protein
MDATSGQIFNGGHKPENTYRYPTRLRKHAANANLPCIGLRLVVSQR